MQCPFLVAQVESSDFVIIIHVEQPFSILLVADEKQEINFAWPQFTVSPCQDLLLNLPCTQLKLKYQLPVILVTLLLWQLTDF